MSLRRGSLVSAAVLVLAVAVPAAAAPCSITICGGKGCPPQNAIVEFTCPETAWQIYLSNSAKGLKVGNAFLRRTPDSSFMRVFSSAHLAEIWVTYHNGKYIASDVQNCHFGATCKRPVYAEDAGPNGQLITMGGDSEATAIAELRDRGVVWMCKWENSSTGEKGSKSRRGQELVVWGVWDPGNYDYIIEYTFRDDGEIRFRMGATGWNHPKFPDEPHMHSALWRVDLDIDGSDEDRALIAAHLEPWSDFLSTVIAADVEFPFNDHEEGSMELYPQAFATLVVEDAVRTNAHGNHIGYELQPFRVGAARHFREQDEKWTQADSWITRFRAEEERAALKDPVYHGPDEYLVGPGQTTHAPWGVANRESIERQDLVLWHNSSLHHHPHDEDQARFDATHGYKGLTLTHWTGFDLVPRNLFDANPLGGPHRAECDGPP